MTDAREPDGPAPGPKRHLTDWTLEQHAEGLLGGFELQAAIAHLEACPRCTAELETYRALFAALGDLPRFAPAPGFADAVMARVRVAPRESDVAVWLRRWLPASRRGWAMLGAGLVAPLLPLAALLAWVLSRPGVSAGSAWSWLSGEGARLVHVAAHDASQWAGGLGLASVLSSLHQFLLGVPTGILVAALAILAVGIPLSVWSLVRLLRTPSGDVSYAN